MFFNTEAPVGKNIRATTAKEQLLKKVRHALLQKREHPYPAFEEAPMYGQADESALDILFAERLTAVAGHFVYCEDEIQLVENLLAMAENEKFNKIYVWDEGIQRLLDTYEFPYYRTDTQFEEAEIGITGCEALIARHGSVLVSNAGKSGRRLSIFPHVHVVIARTSQLVLDIKDGLALIQEKYGDALPSSITAITGPSRTADIEKTLVLGAHGPKTLYVFLLESP